MKIYERKVDEYFVLDKILYGQCFRWKKQKDGKFIGVVKDNVIKIWQEDNMIYFYGMNNKDLDAWFDYYFDTATEYKEIIKNIRSRCRNELLNEIIDYSIGTRILNQDMFEMVVSYIFSASNNIPRISGAIEKLSELYGTKVEFEKQTYYLFPTIEQLKDVTEEDYKEKIRIGFRAPYVASTIDKILNDSEIELEEIAELKTNDAYNMLINLPGIGPKVASCILLFSMNKKDIFPVDVWIEKVMRVYTNNENISKKEIQEVVKRDFGEYAGIINHYMFYWGRESKI